MSYKPHVMQGCHHEAKPKNLNEAYPPKADVAEFPAPIFISGVPLKAGDPERSEGSKTVAEILRMTKKIGLRMTGLERGKDDDIRESRKNRCLFPIIGWWTNMKEVR